MNDLAFAYPDNPEKLIINDINLEVENGEFVCLLGQSGCGKSTLLKLLAGLQKPTRGEITIDGEPIKGASLERTVVFQDYGLFPWMSAGDNILLALQQKYKDRKKQELREVVYTMLEQVGLNAEVYRKLPKELSGGMKQRCAIARSLSVNAPIMLMDEPFGALDAVTRSRLQDLILELWDKDEVKKTVFFVTHDVDEALLLGKRLVVMQGNPGRIVSDYKNPLNKYENIDYEQLRQTKEYWKIRQKLIGQIQNEEEKKADKLIQFG